MTSELGRLGTLASLPSSCTAYRIPLAKAGFYYDVNNTSRNPDNQHELVCFSCNVTCSRWDTGESPAEIHRRLSPDCAHVKTLFPNSSGTFSSMSSGIGSSISSSYNSDVASEQSNSSLSPASSTSGSFHANSISSQSTVLAAGYDSSDLTTDCAAIAPSSHLPGTSVTQSSVTTMSNGHGGYLDDRPTMSMDIAVYPQFSTSQSRLATFRSWPPTHFFDPRTLVSLGFFYAGYADCIRCFYCGVGLKSWEPGDDVTEEHIRWRPHCGFTLATRGRRFVENVLARIQVSTYLSLYKYEYNVRYSQGDIHRCHYRLHSFEILCLPSAESSGTEVVDSGPGRQEPSPPERNRLTSQASKSSPSYVSNASKSSPTRASRSPTHATDSTVTSPTQTNSAIVSSSSSSGAAESEAVSQPSVIFEKIREMGFPKDLVDLVLEEIEATGLPDVNMSVLVDRIVEMQQTSESDSRAGRPDIQTDGEDAYISEEVKRIRRLREENARLKARRLCRTCKTSMVGMIFLPCGHVVSCTECGAKTRHCTLCNELIRATANVFLC
ncbi:hypothetical protein C0Q70_11369 [Pomacea canaliculata]|uniref:RING-type domain-containing protein n=1 Tax=Pomacea canaliculata TaxID=400727 RepID=A0A2T7P5S3_POMCA|nr:hypothetical protein C0Q70_11369 [Pomacea canaliculata]